MNPKKKKVSTPPDETQVDVGEEMETIEDDSEATPPPRPRLKEPPKRRSSRPRVPSNASAGMVWVINERNRLYGQRRNRIRTEKEIEEFRLRKEKELADREVEDALLAVESFSP